MSPRPNRWNDLLAAASEEFRTHGYDAATMDGISQRMGILKGSLYNYVNSKEDLLLAVIREPAEELMAHAARLAADDRPAAERLQELFRTQVSVFSRTYPAAFVYLQGLGRHGNAHFTDLDRRYVAAVESIVADGERTGEFRMGVSPRIAARAVLGILDWMQHWFEPRGPRQDQDLADRLFALAIGGLTEGAEVVTSLKESQDRPQQREHVHE